MGSPSEIAKNNRGREDVGVYMSYKRFDEHLDKTRLEERERIIALLKSAVISAEDANYLIALIKGEN